MEETYDLYTNLPEIARGDGEVGIVFVSRLHRRCCCSSSCLSLSVRQESWRNQAVSN
jgi:hypothetical protein